jgi:hypothetical protein
MKRVPGDKPIELTFACIEQAGVFKEAYEKHGARIVT